MRGVSALCGAEDFVSFLESGGRIRIWGGEDDASELATGDPGKRWLVLIFSTDLEEVEEIGCGRVNSN